MACCVFVHYAISENLLLMADYNLTIGKDGMAEIAAVFSAEQTVCIAFSQKSISWFFARNFVQNSGL